MPTSTREKIYSCIKHYQDAQINGKKDVDKQIQIYTDDSVFISFPVPGVVGLSKVRVLQGKKEIYQAFAEYNNFIKAFDEISIVNKNLMIDSTTLRGGFVMEITTNRAGEIKTYLNCLQMQFNSEMKVVQSLNWQGEVDNKDVLKSI
ncbi:hypothetical protein [Legionella maioricensis]|uniref:SnoaL-like domain-containing protein n=1 Tax=Legionella maioricensis TaxID=2896528 RepID=A0A9X2I9J4_9GAMM|nr:hypothetical protein [Legionella maioricensis]MCL9683374.1 hypothetical protein [Legionella maioricensis]MCL9685930.1 hypothetical protein [Legionella maioricensis]